MAAEGSNGDEGVERPDGDVGDDGDDGPEPGQLYSGDHGAVMASGPEGIEGADGISGADGELAKYVVSTYPGHVGAEYGIQSNVLNGGGVRKTGRVKRVRSHQPAVFELFARQRRR